MSKKRRFEYRNEYNVEIIWDNDKNKIVFDEEVCDLLNELCDNISVLEKWVHIMSMKSLFSTVKSFHGDVSKRYKYNEEQDVIFDTANHYGSYYEILDNKDITMRLNEYETILNDMNVDEGSEWD